MNPWDIHAVCEHEARARTLTRPPSTNTSLVFSLRPDGESHLVVLGPRTRAAYFSGKKLPFTVNAELHTGWARTLLGVPARDLVDQIVPLSELWGDTELHESVAAEPARAAELMEKALSDRMADNPAGELVGEAAQWLHRERLPETARRLNVSERHLRTLFTGTVGVSPKRFVQLNRVRSVLSRADARKGAQLAAESGYYDQSHMTAEFRATMGVPLSAYLAGDLPSVASAC
nr:helix-turn-helix domain-containing protein [Kibdelosporangium sp. MJ126-NF4]CEL14687.1 Transcriptional regulator, AraC family [Kibdelosporangium sp. MJ126-NF4]CTQ96683.1 Transcriptional regulator, AraC family [Kibdelosporangium sp. MJ126-NF4]